MKTIKALIKHLVSQNLPIIAAKSKLHCHTRNVHSILLLDSPGQTIRLFIAVPGHELYLNDHDNTHIMSVGFHPHHCNVTLSVVLGEVGNWNVYTHNGEYNRL